MGTEKIRPIAKAILNPRRAVFYLYLYLHSFAMMLLRGRRYLRVTADMPTRPYAIWKTCRLLGITPSRHRGALAFHHVDRTWCAPSPIPAINGTCCDIAKTTVARAFEESFGYPLLIADPRTHHGELVAKSELNAPNDGVLLHGPVARPDSGVCYQRAIDTRTGDGRIVDIRTLVVGREIVQATLKYRHATPEHRFDTSIVLQVVPLEPSAVFSPSEQRCILAVCRRIGLDFGELDILRDRADGRIYIVDAAKTPCAPSECMTLRQKIALMKRVARAFERQFCPPVQAAPRDALMDWHRRGGAAR